MKNLLSYLASAGFLACTLFIAGCGEESGTKVETKTTAPDGSSTKVTDEHKVETKGDTPPPAVAPAEPTKAP